MKLISDAVKDALNGGIDRNCDGVIDKKDRDLMFEEESIKKKASAQYEYVDDEPDEYDTDFDDFDDVVVKP